MNKSRLIKECKKILSNYRDGEIICESDQIFMIEVFRNHPDFEIKKGCGIDYFFVKRTKYGNLCFNIKRIDGSTTNISYIQSISPKDKWNDVKMACRSAIRPKIEELKSLINFGVDRCRITGEILTKENLHFDHFSLTFEELFKYWSSKYDREYLISQLNDTRKDNEIECYFTNKELINDFLIDHALLSCVRPVTKLANLSILKRKNETTSTVSDRNN